MPKYWACFSVSLVSFTFSLPRWASATASSSWGETQKKLESVPCSGIPYLHLAAKERQELFCCDICGVLCISLHSILTASLQCGFWLLSSPSSRGNQATSSPPSSPNGTINYISFLTLHQPKQPTKMLLWNLSMDKTYFHDRGFQDS